MSNSLAFFMLFAWPVLALVAFRRLPLAAGISAAILGAFLLLPTRTAINLPMLPTFDKDLSGMLAAIVLIVYASSGRNTFGQTPAQEAGPKGWLPRSRWTQFGIASMLIGLAITATLNGDALRYGPTVIRGLSEYDIFSSILTELVVLLPFLIARKYLATPEAQRLFLLTLIVSASLYVIPTLWEVRMSPQLSFKIYGFFPASFAQHMRADGFRPLVFLRHGLHLSLFLSLAYLAALAWARYFAQKRKKLAYAVAAVLFCTLVLSKSLGALGIALLLGPIMFFAPRRIQLLVAAGITSAALLYPVLRGNGLVPINQVMEVAESIDAQRANSLRFRLENEDALLGKAAEKPVFGWGGWGRWRIYNKFGTDISVSDGAWVVLFGRGGWVLYLSSFGLLCLPVILSTMRSGRHPPDPAAIALSLLLAANMIDLIPNSGLLPVTWMMAGALTGRLERLQQTPDPAKDAAQARDNDPPPPDASEEGLYQLRMRGGDGTSPSAPAALYTPRRHNTSGPSKKSTERPADDIRYSIPRNSTRKD